jgi:2-methylcitrate dehydratase PrpD
MADRVEFKLAYEFERAYPERLGARVRIDWRNGRSDEIIIENPKGSPEDPMTDLDLRKKYLSLAAPLFGQKNSEDIIASVEKLDATPKLESLSNLLRTL